MTTCKDIIQSAYRRGGIIGQRVAMNADQQVIGLERLQEIYQEMSQGLLGQVCDYYLASGNYTALENQRIYCASGASVITLPVTVVDCINGGTRAPLDGSIVMVVKVGSDPQINVYNALTATWQNIVDLTATSIAPLSMQFEAPIKNMLAVILCDENGMEAPRVVMQRAAMGKLAIASRRQTKASATKGQYF